MNSIADKLMRHLYVDDKKVILLGTAHVSKESVELVGAVIDQEKPDTVCVELCQSRYQAIMQKEKWLETNIIRVIKDKKAFLLLSNLLLASFQKRIADKFAIKPGQEMIKAIETGKAVSARIIPADREIQITLSRTWRLMGFIDKIKILIQLVFSVGDIGDISEADIEKMKEQDILQSLLADVEKSAPVLKNILIDERDRYLAQKIKTAPGRKIVAVVGAGHVPGIKKCWGEDIDLIKLEELPPKKRISNFCKWFLPLFILALLFIGFFFGDAEAGPDMITWWIAANGIMAGLGALIAFAHPFTILSAILAAPLTSLNPMIAAGWVSGLVEAFARKPKVKDFEDLSQDIITVKGFWKNKVTRILLVVVFTNLGSAIGTFIAVPMMLKLIHQ